MPVYIYCSTCLLVFLHCLLNPHSFSPTLTHSHSQWQESRYFPSSYILLLYIVFFLRVVLISCFIFHPVSALSPPLHHTGLFNRLYILYYRGLVHAFIKTESESLVSFCITLSSQPALPKHSLSTVYGVVSSRLLTCIL